MTQIDTSRELNLGIKVGTKKFGEVTVKELSLESLLSLAQDISKLVFAMTSSIDSAEDDSNWIVRTIGDPRLFNALRSVMIAATGLQAEQFTDVPASDWLRLVKALKEVTDWEETKELFFEIVPRQQIQKLLQRVSQQGQGAMTTEAAPSSQS